MLPELSVIPSEVLKKLSSSRNGNLLTARFNNPGADSCSSP
jgi:hypothetical protein